MRVLGKINRYMIFYRALDGHHIFAHCKAGAIANAKDMRINSLRRITKPHIQNHIRRFTPYSRQAFQSCPRLWNLAIKLIDQPLRQLNDVLRLVSEQANRVDVLDYTVFAERQHLLRRICHFKQPARCFIHTLIGGLSR